LRQSRLPRVASYCHDALMGNEQMSRTYRIVMAIATPIVRRWGRLEVVGEELIPLSGPTLLISNHDSYWDPVVIGVAGRNRRQICALAKSTLWKNKIVGRVLDGMGQIPIERGRGDTQALDAAIKKLGDGACIGVFPEGTISRGVKMRAHSGAGRLALAVPETVLVCAAVTGSVDLVRFPKRPRVTVTFFEPGEGQAQPGESSIRLTKRTTAEIRLRAPYALPGRRKTAEKLRRLAAEQAASAAKPPTEA
jgi:1-acyl-sn-glycerol-3-phosphate acyltransferase